MPPCFDRPTLTRLLGSIESDNLLLLCGAGVSIPWPSNLLSAVRVAQLCYEKYRPIQELPPILRDNIDGLAGHFHATGQLKNVFVKALVPWNELVGEPNIGHAAIGDLLVTRALNATLSTNFDTMIEQWAKTNRIAMRGAVKAAEVAHFDDSNAPLLKLHGCVDRREDTLWTAAQLAEPDVMARQQAWADWISLNLPGRDLLIVGFWTDWQYLNDVFQTVITGAGLPSVTVVDLSSSAELRLKAPALWTSLEQAGVFIHVQGSSDVALEELRIEFSRTWLRKFFQLGAPAINLSGAPCPPAAYEPPAGPMAVLYDLRRDAEGVPASHAAQARSPAVSATAAAFAHLLLKRVNAASDGAWYQHGARKVRVVNGAGEVLSSVRARHVVPPAAAQPDVVICAGSTDLGGPGHIVATGHGASFVRPTPGGVAAWLALDEARTELGL